MASVLKVDTIKSLTGNEAMTITESGGVSFTTQPTVPVPAFSVYAPTNISVPASNTDKELVLTTVDYDFGSWYDTNTGRYTPQIEGYYSFSGNIGIDSGTRNWGRAQIRKNSTASNIYLFYFSSDPSGLAVGNGTKLIYLNGDTDYVSLWGGVSYAGTPIFVAGACALSGFLVRGA